MTVSTRTAAAVLALLLAAAPAGARSAESAASVPELDARTERELVKLVFRCGIKLAEKTEVVERIQQELAGAESSAAWLNEQAAAERDADEHRRLINSCVSCSAGLADAYRRAEQVAVRKRAPEAARAFRAARARHLKVLRATVNSLDGRLWMAGEFHALGDFAEARIDYRFVLDRFDPDADGRGLADAALADLEKAKEALRRTPGMDVMTLPAERQRLDEVRLCLRGRAAGPGRPARGPDYARGARLIREFLKQHPAYGREPGGRSGTIRRDLAALETEMDFRARLLHARRRVVGCCVSLAAGGGEQQAPELYREGLAEANRIVGLLPRDGELRVMRAECLLGAGRAREARADFQLIRRGLAAGGELWWRATAGLYRASLAAGDRDSARKLLARLTIDFPREAPARLKP